MMFSRQSVYAALHVKAEEEKPVLLLLCYSFFSGVSIYVFYIVANALFLVNYSKSMLPVAYIGGGVLLFFIGKINVSFQRKIDFSVLSVALIIFQFISLAVMMYAYEATSWKGITLIMFIWNRISVYVSNVTFWTSSSKIFNLEQAKRIFSLIATGDVVASIASYFAVNMLLSANVMQTEELLYISMAALLVSLVFMLLIIGKYKRKLAVRSDNLVKDVDGESIEKPFFNNNYHVLIFLLGMLPVLGVYFGEFIFSVEVKRQFPVKDQLTAFLSQFFLISAIIELLVKVFFYRFAIRTFGLVSGIIILPVALIIVLTLAVFLTSLDFSVFFYILLSRFLCISIKKSFSDTSFQILYQPLSKSESQELQNKVEIYAKPLGYILAGLILLFLMRINLGEPIQVMCVFVVILVGWTFASFRMQAEYQTMLGNIFSGLGISVRKSNFDGGERKEAARSQQNPDSTSRPVAFEEIVAKTQSARLEEKLEAIELLGKSGRYLAFKHLIPFLQEKDEILRTAAIRAAGVNGSPELWPYLFENICSENYFPAALDAIKNVGEPVMPALAEYFDKSGDDEYIQLRVIDVATQVDNSGTNRFLRQTLVHPSLAVRHKSYEALAAKGYAAKLNERPGIIQEAGLQIGFMVWLIAAQRDLNRNGDLFNSPLSKALEEEYDHAVSKLINILTILTRDKRLYFIQDSIRSQDENTKSYLLEILNMTIPAEHKNTVLPLFEDISASEKLAKFSAAYPQQKLSPEERLHDLINKDFARLSTKTKILAIHALELFPSAETSFILVANAVSPVKTIARASLEILYKVDHLQFEELYLTMRWNGDAFHCMICDGIEKNDAEMAKPVDL